MSTELSGKIEGVEKKIKLSNLLSGKKFADVELKIGKLQETFKEFSSDVLSLKERAEEIEDLLQVINLGLVGFNKKFENVDARFETLEKLPENVKRSIFEYEKKLRDFDENIKKISTTLSTFKGLKDEVSVAVEEKILPEIQALKTSSEINKTEIESIKRDLNVFSSSIKSFERTIELTNLDKIIERFEKIEHKVTDAQLKVEKFRKTFSGLSLVDVDVKNLKEDMNALSTTVMEKLSDLNDLQRNLKIINQKMQDINFFETINQLKSELKQKEAMILDDRAKIEELGARIDRVSAMGMEHLEPIKQVDKEIQEKMAGLDLTSIEELYGKSEQMYNAMVERIAKLKDLDKKLRVFEAEARARTLPPDVNDILIKVRERLENVENRYNQVLEVLKKEVKSIKGDMVRPDELNSKIEKLQKALISRDKSLSDYQKQMEKRLRSFDKKKGGKIPEEIVKKIDSLEKTIDRLTAENEEIRKLAREIKMAQLDVISHDSFTGLVNNVKVLENKITDFEKGITAKKPDEGVAILKVVDDLSERVKTLENKIKDFEQIPDKEALIKRKEFESLMNLKADLEREISDIKKKISEGSTVQPVILE